jgi:ribosomal protein L16 Arg81 hydroxylase
MSKFKGYAQSSGFKNIQLPDTTRKIREEGQRTIRQMQATFDAKQANSKAVINALNDKYRVEEQNRQFVFDLETENRNQIRARMVENNKTINDNAEIERNKSQQTFAALAKFSETASKVANDIAQRADESGKKKGAQLANTIALAGGSYADIQYIRDLDKAHIANDEKYRNIVKRLIANGAPNELINQVRNANSSVAYGLQRPCLLTLRLIIPKPFFSLKRCRFY